MNNKNQIKYSKLILMLKIKNKITDMFFLIQKVLQI